MAPADEASTYDASQKSIPHVLRAFPSPALSNVSLDSPTLTKTLSCLTSPGYGTSYPNPLETFGIMPAEPGAAKNVPVMTPPASQRRGNSDPTMNMIVGGALAPVHDVQPRPQTARVGPGLRLPSFQKLGIAAPHPDRLASTCADGVWTDSARAGTSEGGAMTYPGVGETMLSQVASITGAEQHEPPHQASPKATARPPNVPFAQFVQTLTPPAETGDPAWQPPTIGFSLASAAMDSSATPGAASSQAVSGGEDAVAVATSAVQNVTISAPTITGDRAWLDGAVQAIRE